MLHLTHSVSADASLGSDYYEKASVVKGHHVYKAVWTPFLGEELSVQPEDHNDHDEHAIAVTTRRLIEPCVYSRTSALVPGVY